VEVNVKVPLHIELLGVFVLRVIKNPGDSPVQRGTLLDPPNSTEKLGETHLAIIIGVEIREQRLEFLLVGPDIHPLKHLPEFLQSQVNSRSVRNKRKKQQEENRERTGKPSCQWCHCHPGHRNQREP